MEGKFLGRKLVSCCWSGAWATLCLEARLYSTEIHTTTKGVRESNLLGYTRVNQRQAGLLTAGLLRAFNMT